MAYELRERRGSLFANCGRKRANQPAYTGKIKLGGVLYHLSAWEQQSRNGTRWLSIAADEFAEASQGTKPDAGRTEEAQERKLSTEPPQHTGQHEFDDGVPF